MIEQINQLKQGSIISESSHYIVNRVSGSSAWLTHFESGEEVQIGMSYLKNHTNSADLFETTVKVTKEDKKDGTLGIRSIWENIHSGQVFTVCFKKQDKPKSKRKLQKEINAIVEQFSNSIDTVKNNKKGVANAASNSLRQNVSGIAKNVSNSFKSGTGITGKLGSAANTLTGNYYGTAWNSATGTTLQKAGTVLKQTAHDTGANMVKAATTAKNKGQEKLDKLTGKRGEKLTGDAAAKKLSSGKNKVTADQIENAIKNNKGELQVGDKTYKVSKATKDGTTTYSYELKGNKSTQYMANENGADRVVTKETKSIDKVNRGTGKKDGVRYKVLDDGKSVEVTTSRNATKVDTFIHDAQVNPYTGMPQSGNVFRTGITIASGNAADTTEDITESIAYQSTPMATVNTQTGREYYLEDYSIMSEDEVNQAYSDIMAQSQEIQL